ncbi:MAG: hypothetical protein QOF82_1567 [Frankiales bacterium]|nr:hypothetical protein [Frankiales bacterium]MDX6212480.1 hypothetical protein [Frankiales bacterium]
MPTGVYRFSDGRAERFSTVLAPAGWSYVGDNDDGSRVELTVDSRWRPVRCEVSTPRWRVRGGSLGRQLMWVRSAADGTSQAEDGAEAAGFLAESPAFLVVLPRLLSLPLKGSAWVRMVTLWRPLLAPLVVERGWTLEAVDDHETPSGPLVVERYRVDDRATGEHVTIQLAGDVVLDGPDVELEDLEGPPNQPARRPG